MISRPTSKTSSRALVAAAAALMLSSCSDPFSLAKQAVRDEMKDPEATNFRDVAWCGKPGGAVYGEYNSKNSYGAYEGFKDFYYADGVVAVSFDTFNFEQVYRRCMVEMAQRTAEISGKPFDNSATENRLDALFAPDPLPDLTERARAEHTVKADAADDEVPVCDRPDSPEKFALMKKIGTNCLGE